MCSLCRKTFIGAKDLTAHMRSHTEQSPYQCAQCLQSFEHQEDLHKHQQIGCEVATQPEEDNMSTASFEEDNLSATSFEDGIEASEPNGTSPLSPTTSNVRPNPKEFSKARTCHVCQETFQSAYLMRKHLNSKHDQLPYQCLDCGEHFKRKFNLREHKANCHCTPSSKARKRCLCNTTFNSPYLMRKHLKSQHDQLPYQCRDCGHFFKLKFNLKKHKKKCPALKRR